MHWMAQQSTDFTVILEALREHGINDYKLAKMTGIDRSVLSKLRTGSRKQPNYDMGVLIMEAYQRELVDNPAQ